MDKPLSELLALLDASGRRLHVLMMRLTLRSEAAEDLLQELFLKLHQSQAFRRSRDPLAYATRAAINLAFDWRRKLKSRPQHVTISTELTVADPSPLDKLIGQEELGIMLDALGELHETSRRVLVQRYIMDESYETVAEHLSKTPHQVRALCAKAVVRLRVLVHRKMAQGRGKEEKGAKR